MHFPVQVVDEEAGRRAANVHAVVRLRLLYIVVALEYDSRFPYFYSVRVKSVRVHYGGALEERQFCLGRILAAQRFVHFGHFVLELLCLLQEELVLGDVALVMLARAIVAQLRYKSFLHVDIDLSTLHCSTQAPRYAASVCGQ